MIITEERRQQLAGACKRSIEHLQRQVDNFSLPGGEDLRQMYQQELERQQIALAALEAKPVGAVNRGEVSDSNEYPDARVDCIHEQADWENFADGELLYTAPPAPVMKPIEWPNINDDRYQWSDGAYNLKMDMTAIIRAAGYEIKGG